ncbi:TPA: hypothetical protein N2810_004753 [Vibrio parahaemolyticus]|nr:hypothetical protein [Vibrio parahaemolyticus]
MCIPEVLVNNRDAIVGIEPQKQAISYDLVNWNKYFQQDTSFQEITLKHPFEITRNILFDKSKLLESNYSWASLRELFIAVMLWGFGSVGYGAYRTHKMVSDVDFKETLESTYFAIKQGDISRAYGNFKLEQCGPAFFTKFFYFVAHGFNRKPIPLILDSVVARNIETRCKLNIDSYARVNRDKNGRILSLRPYKEGYLQYVADMNNWARDLDATPDQLEFFLFS